MNEPLALFPLVREEIHFDTLMEAAHTVIDAYSGQIWTDTDAHDPGITLLEALCYGVSDLSYRTSLPLIDLLTPSPTSGRTTIFPAAFGPQRVLTVGPITANDYRKAILDLYSEDDGPFSHKRYFYFRDAQLVRESEDEAYTYWYDPATHTYTFSEPHVPEGASEPDRFILLGNYTLYVERTRDGYATSSANAALPEFLRNNRNLCEMVRKIVWMEVQDVFPTITLELEDDVQDAAPVLASLFAVVDNYISPPVRRYRASELLQKGMAAEDVYNGPALVHGWIPELPPARDLREPITLDLSGLASQILAIDGVASIAHLAWKGTSSWVLQCKAGYFPLAWGRDPLYNLADLDDVQLLKHGQRYRATKPEIQALLPSADVIDEEPVTLPAGQWRNPARYHPATDWIPPCYDLQNPQPPESTVQLHRFMLPFEQQLADGCQQLAQLPDLLNFGRTTDTPMWGWQWPFAPDSVPDIVHQVYKTSLQTQLRSQQQDSTQQLRLIDYLLGYFGAQRAARILPTLGADFLKVQRGYLSELGDLGYQRANIRTDQVSALQKRIAARLGLGPQLFGTAVDMESLPFYLVENRGLLSPIPETPVDQLIDVARVNVDGDMLWVNTDVAQVAVGELIDLVLDPATTLRTITVRAVESSRFGLSIADSVVLQNNLDRVVEASRNGTLQWHSSNVWLTTMEYQLVYASDQSGLDADQKRLASGILSPFPVRLAIGDTIAVSPGFGPLGTDSSTTPGEAAGMTATVVSVDALAGTYVVSSSSSFPSTDDAPDYRWYQTEDVTDRYSFTISLVFPRSMLDGVADPAVTEQWMKQVVWSEIPADVGVQFYWFDMDQFRTFAATYKRWLANDGLAGDYAYQLLFQLALGVKPQVELGISLMKIASDAERLQVVGKQGDEWNTDVILDKSLFYVPPSSGSRSLKV